MRVCCENITINWIRICCVLGNNWIPSFSVTKQRQTLSRVFFHHPLKYIRLNIEVWMAAITVCVCYYWLKKRSLVSHSIMLLNCVEKFTLLFNWLNNPSRVFPRFSPATCNCFPLWLAHLLSLLSCDSWIPLQNALLLNLFNFRREFARAKTCLKDKVTEHCTFDADAMEILQSAFDSYNPFCNVPTENKGEFSARELR